MPEHWQGLAGRNLALQAAVPDPLRLLCVSHSAGLGGAERVLLDMIAGFDPDKVQTTVVLPAGGPLGNAVSSHGARVHVVPMRWWLAEVVWPRYWRYFWADAVRSIEPLVRIVRDERIDVVYSCSSPVLHGALAALVCRKPHVFHMQDLLGWPHIGLRTPLGRPRLAYALMGQLSSIVVCPGRVMRADVGPFVSARKCRVVHYGVTMPEPRERPEPELAGAPGDPIRIGLVGVVCARKGSELIAEIVRRACARCPNLHFYWIGAGPATLTAALSEASTIDGQPHLHFVGFRDPVGPALAAMDVLLHPARNDAFPRVLLEAAARGLPVVATRSGGAEEMVRHNETGLLAPVDDAEALAGAVVKLAVDPGLRKRFSTAARAHAATFTMMRFHEGMAEAINSAHAAGAAPRSAAGYWCAMRLLHAPALLQRVRGMRVSEPC